MEHRDVGSKHSYPYLFVITVSFFLGHLCYEKNYRYVGNALKVYNNGRNNHKENVYSVEECQRECQRYEACHWWNYVTNQHPDPTRRNTCWLKTGQGKKEPIQNHFTGSRISDHMCQSREYFTPASYQSSRRSNSNNNAGWLSWMNSNPCPNGKKVSNCYESMDNCVECCTGEQAGTDGTPACVHK